MGLTELPNGMEYFSVAEELKVFLEIIFSIFNPINISIIIIMTLLLAVTMIYMTFRNAEKMAEGAN